MWSKSKYHVVPQRLLLLIGPNGQILGFYLPPHHLLFHFLLLQITQKQLGQTSLPLARRRHERQHEPTVLVSAVLLHYCIHQLSLLFRQRSPDIIHQIRQFHSILQLRMAGGQFSSGPIAVKKTNLDHKILDLDLNIW